jgi:hypothetical protein
VQVAKATRLIGRVSPGRVSRGAGTHWPDLTMRAATSPSRQAFARWDPRVLDDYLAHGFEPGPRRRRALAFRREVETRFYNTLPHHLGPAAPHPPRCPVAFVGGTQSTEVRQVGMAATRAGHPRACIEWIAGTHLVPDGAAGGGGGGGVEGFARRLRACALSAARGP